MFCFLYTLLLPHDQRLYPRRANLLSQRLIEQTVVAFPRLQWSSCFADVINKELALKPWCHTSTFEVPDWKAGIPSNFATDVKANELMNRYD